MWWCSTRSTRRRRSSVRWCGASSPGLNPEAAIVEANFGAVALDSILGTGRFDFDRAREHPLWFKELYQFAEHKPETLEYGVESFVYRARRPFHPARLHAAFQRAWPGVIRSKGHFWLATRPGWVGEMSQAGAILRHEAIGFWWAAVPRERWPQDPEMRGMIEARWDPVFGDRRQELVFIGIGLDQDAIRRDLDSCLLDPAAAAGFDPAAWADLPDPFPAWRRAA